MIEKKKTEVMTVKCHRDEKRISLFSWEEKNNENNIGDNTDSNKAKNK